jgi:hypothetical protein
MRSSIQSPRLSVATVGEGPFRVASSLRQPGTSDVREAREPPDPSSPRQVARESRAPWARNDVARPAPEA